MSENPKWSSWIGPAAGAALFAAGLVQARSLGAGGLAEARKAAAGTGPARIGAGALLLARPRLIPRLLGAGDSNAPSPVSWTRRAWSTSSPAA